MELIQHNGCIMKIEVIGDQNKSSNVVVTSRSFSVQSMKWDSICTGPNQIVEQISNGHSNTNTTFSCDVPIPIRSIQLIFAREIAVNQRREVLILLGNTHPVMQWFEGQKQPCHEYHCLLLSNGNLEMLHAFHVPFKIESENVCTVLNGRCICVGNNRRLFVVNLDGYEAIQALKCDQIIQIFDVHYDTKRKVHVILAKTDKWGSKKVTAYLISGCGTSSLSIKETGIEPFMPDVYSEIITSLHLTHSNTNNMDSTDSDKDPSENRLLICTSYSQAVLFGSGKILHCTPLELDEHEAVTDINLFENQEGKEFYVLITSLQNVTFLEADSLQVLTIHQSTYQLRKGDNAFGSFCFSCFSQINS